jgi:hypothetical protein
MKRQDAYNAIAIVEGAAIQLGNAMNLETQLADERALVKHAGIQRLLDAKTFTSVTAAEKGIEFDQIYLEHRGKERAAVADRIFWEGKLKAATLRAQLAVELCAIDEQAQEPDLETQDSFIQALLDSEGVPDRGDEGEPLTLVQRVQSLLPAKESDFSADVQLDGFGSEARS